MYNNTMCALDIGEFYTKVVIGSYVNDKIEVIFAKKIPTKGISNGDIVNKGEVLSTITTLQDSVNQYGLSLNDVILVLPNKTLGVSGKKANITLPYGSKQITNNEIRSLKEACTKHNINPNDVVISIEAISYSLDGRSFGKKPPIGFNGDSISLDAYIYTMRSTIFNGLNDVLEACNINVKHIIINSVATASYILTDEMRKNGAYVIDIGQSSNSISFFKDDILNEFKEGKYGGSSLTLDLARGLEVDKEDAEIIKTTYSTCYVDKASNIEVVRANNHLITEREIVDKTIVSVVNLANDIKHTLDLMITNKDNNYVIALSGGNSAILGIDKILQQELDNKVIVRNRNDFGARDKVFYPCIGAIKYFSKR